MLRELARKIDRFQERFGQAVSWLMFLLVLVVFGDVIMRYAFRISFVFVQELEWHLFGAIFLLAGGYVTLHNEHIRVDIVYSRLAPRTKAWLDFVLMFLFYFPACWLVMYTAWPFVKAAYDVSEESPDPGGIPYRWVVKSAMIVGFAFLALQGVSQAIKNFYWAMGWEEPEHLVQEIH